MKKSTTHSGKIAHTKSRRTARVPISDEQLIGRVQENAPEALNAVLSEAALNAVVEGLLNEAPLSDEVPHFYCRKCREYHLKIHQH